MITILLFARKEMMMKFEIILLKSRYFIAVINDFFDILLKFLGLF